MLEQFLRVLGFQRLDPPRAQVPARHARMQALQAQDQTGALMHQAHPPPQQIPHRPHGPVTDIAGRQNVQAQHLRQKKAVRFVVGVLEPVVLLHGRRVGQDHRITVVLQSVHQPIPVVSRFHRNLLQTFLKRFERLQHALQIARQLLLKDALAIHIHDRAKQIVAMQIDSSHTLLRHTVSFRFVVFVYSDNNVLPEGNLPSHFALNVYQSSLFALFAVPFSRCET